MIGKLYFNDGSVEDVIFVNMGSTHSMSFSTNKNRYEYFVDMCTDDEGFTVAKGTFFKYIKGINRWTVDKSIKGIKLEVAK